MNTLLAVLVRLFPAPFRDQFGADMVEDARTELVRARSRGRLYAVACVLTTVLDLLWSALAERLNPAWNDASVQPVRRTGSGDIMMDWLKDFRHAARALRRAPMFTVVTVATLGLAIGANAGIFSVVDTVLLDPLPYPGADRLVHIAASAPGSDFPDEFGVAAEFFVQYSEEADQLEDVSTYNSFTATLRTDERAERIRMSILTPSIFSTLQVAPVLGRLPVPEDEDHVAVISHDLWVDWFGSDPAVLGRSYAMAGAVRTIIGVMAPGFWFPREGTMLWIPLPIRAEGIELGRFGQSLVGRLADGATQESLAEQLRLLALRIPERFGRSAAYARLIEQHRPVVRSLEEELVGATARPLWVLLGSVIIVLLIACANVANLFLVRTEHHQRDLAVRQAIGAGRGQLIRLQMAEAGIIAGLAGVLAILLARVSVPLFVRAAPEGIPRLMEAGLSAPVLLFTLGASVFSALLCGLLPAIRASKPDLTRLRDGGRGSTRRRHWGRDGLVVAQTSLALVLLIGSGLLVRSLVALRHVDPGYDTADIFTFQIAPEAAYLTDGPSWARFHMDFLDRIAALPGVESVGIVENVPLNESVSSMRFRTEETADDPDSGSLLGVTFTGGDYYRTMGIEVLRGRAFGDADHTTNLGNAILSSSAAELLFPGEDPVGRRVTSEFSDWATVVGVVEDVLQNDFREAPDPMIYLPLTGPTPVNWALSSPAYVVKTGRAETIAPEIRSLVRQVAPEAPMYRMYTMKRLAADSMVRLSFTMLMLGIASVLALILGAIGLYAVLSTLVAERTAEIGVRMALGAQAMRVQRMIVAQGIRVVIIGVAIGIAVAIIATRVLASLLFGVDAFDVWTFLGMSATMIAVGLLASYLPARRASNVDPIRSLSGN